MTDLGKTWYCLTLQIKQHKDRILLHQEIYTQKVLRFFSHHKANSLSTHMIIHSLDIKKDINSPKEDDEQILSLECSYLGVIGVLFYLVECTRPNIFFAVKCLARHSIVLTHCHWNGVKEIFRYLKGTTDIGLYYPYVPSNGSTLMILKIMQPLSTMRMHVTYQTHIRDVPNLVILLQSETWQYPRSCNKPQLLLR